MSLLIKWEVSFDQRKSSSPPHLSSSNPMSKQCVKCSYALVECHVLEQEETDLFDKLWIFFPDSKDSRAKTEMKYNSYCMLLGVKPCCKIYLFLHAWGLQDIAAAACQFSVMAIPLEWKRGPWKRKAKQKKPTKQKQPNPKNLIYPQHLAC